MTLHRHIIILIFIHLVFLGQDCNLFGQNSDVSPVHNYPLSIYQGNPQNWCIAEDHRGIMYFANQDGFVLEYDGVEWRNINMPELTSVRSLGIDSAGTIYVGTVDNFGYLSPDPQGNLKYVSLIHLLDTTDRDFGEIWSIAINGDEVFFQAWNMLFQLKNNQIKIWRLPDLYHRCFVVHNKFYIRQKTVGITVLQKDTFELIPGGEQFSEETISAMVPFSENKIIIGTRTKGLFIYDPDNLGKPICKFKNKADKFLTKNKLYHGIAIGKDKFAFATLLQGIVIINHEGEILRKYSMSNLLMSNATYFMHNQNEEIIWAVQENGINKILINSPLQFLNKFIGSAINDITRFDKKLFLATDVGVVYFDSTENLSAKHIHKISGVSELSWNFLNVRLPDKNKNGFTNKLLLANSNGLYEIINNRAILLNEIKKVFSLHSAKKDPTIVYVGFKDGLYICKWDYKTNSWTSSLVISNINSEIRYIAEDSDNSLWLVTLYDGIYRLSPARIKTKNNEYVSDYSCTIPYKLDHFTTENGLPTNKGFICTSFQGDVIFPSAMGLYKYDKSSNHFTLFSSIHPILAKKSTVIFRLGEDPNGNMWTDFGAIFFKQQDNSFVIDTLSLKKLSGKRVDAIYPEKNGITWYGGDELYRYDSNIKLKPQKEYPTLIRKVSLDKDSVIFGGTNFNTSNQVCIEQPKMLIPIIEYKFNSLSFEYAAIFFEDEKSLQYSYKLDNFDTKWSQWSSESKKEYTNLFEGEYTFMVKAKNIYDIESTIGTYSFEILPPAHRTLWAYTLYLLFFGFIIYSAIRINARRLKAINIRLEDQVRERTKEIEAQKEELAAQRDALAVANATKDKFFSIISHDLKSPFNSLLGFGQVMMENFPIFSKEKLAKYIEQMYNSSRQLYNLVENLLDWSRSKTGTIKSYPEKINLSEVVCKTLDISKLSASKKHIQVMANIDTNITVFADENLILTIIRNLVSNAIKYSVENSTIVVSSKLNKDFVQISITDSGIGIKQEDLAKLFREDVHYTTSGTNKEKGTGLGLILCKEFVEKNGGKIWVESVLEKGTTFTFTLPKYKGQKK